MADEVNEAFRFTRTTLLADSTFAAAMPRVYATGEVPQTPTFPFCLIDVIPGGPDVAGLGTVRLMTEPLFLIRIVNKGSIDSSVRAADIAMDNVLQNIDAAVLDNYEYSVRREKPYRTTYRDSNNNLFSESGGYYRFFITKL